MPFAIEDNGDKGVHTAARLKMVGYSVMSQVLQRILQHNDNITCSNVAVSQFVLSNLYVMLTQ